MPSHTRTVLGLIMRTTVKQQLEQITTEVTGAMNPLQYSAVESTQIESHTTLANTIAVATLSCPILADAEIFMIIDLKM